MLSNKAHHSRCARRAGRPVAMHRLSRSRTALQNASTRVPERTEFIGVSAISSVIVIEPNLSQQCPMTEVRLCSKISSTPPGTEAESYSCNSPFMSWFQSRYQKLWNAAAGERTTVSGNIVIAWLELLPISFN